MTYKDSDTLLMESLIGGKTALERLEHITGGKLGRTDADLASIERALRDAAEGIRLARSHVGEDDDVFEVGETDD
jgi:hypothetical protein